MNDIVNAALLVYAGLFPIVNPVGGAPIFLSLTRHCPDAERRKMAGRVTVNSFFLLLACILVGSYVLQFFGISLPALRVAGGLVVTSFAWQLLQSGGTGEDQRSAHGAERPVDAFYPLTMPLTVGPGSISVAITLGTHRPAPSAGVFQYSLVAGGTITGLLAIALTIFLCYRFAERIVTVLGPRGTSVMIRLSAFILLCIGIEILWHGCSGFIDLAKTAVSSSGSAG